MYYNACNRSSSFGAQLIVIFIFFYSEGKATICDDKMIACVFLMSTAIARYALSPCKVRHLKI